MFVVVVGAVMTAIVIIVVCTIVVVIQKEGTFERFHVGSVIQEEHVGSHASVSR